MTRRTEQWRAESRQQPPSLQKSALETPKISRSVSTQSYTVSLKVSERRHIVLTTADKATKFSTPILYTKHTNLLSSYQGFLSNLGRWAVSWWEIFNESTNQIEGLLYVLREDTMLQIRHQKVHSTQMVAVSMQVTCK